MGYGWARFLIDLGSRIKSNSIGFLLNLILGYLLPANNIGQLFSPAGRRSTLWFPMTSAIVTPSHCM